MNPRFFFVLLLLATGFPLAASASLPAAEAAEPPPELVVPRPDLEALGQIVEERITEMQAEAEKLLAQEPLPRKQLTVVFGFLGQMFEAFALHDAAATAFANAAALSDEFMWHYYLGLAHHAQGDFPAAAEQYRETLERSPGYTAARIRLGDTLLELGRTEEARDTFASVLESDPENASALRGAGEAALRLGEVDAAVDFLEKALRLAPKADSLHYPLSQAYRRQGRVDLARRHLSLHGETRVPLDDPLANSITSLSNGMAFQVVRELAEEEEDFSERNFLGFVFSRLGQIEVAPRQIDEIVRGMEEEGADARARGRLRWAQGALLAAQNVREPAVESLREAVELDPGLIEARVLLADLHSRSGDFEAALDAYEKALALDPDHREARVRRAAVLTRVGRFDAALEVLEELHRDLPDDLELVLDIGSVLEQSGREDAARARFREVVEKGRTRQERARGHLALAGMELRSGDAEAALAAYRTAGELDPDSIGALAGQARLLGALGRFDEAADLYGRAVELEPRSVEHRRGEATALILGGRHGEAVERLEAGLVLLPNSVELQEILARHLAASPDPSARDGKRAVELARELYEERPTPVTLETLAMAHAEAGDFEQAVSWQEKLMETAAEYEGTDDYVRMRANLELYRQERPCCADP